MSVGRTFRVASRKAQHTSPPICPQAPVTSTVPKSSAAKTIAIILETILPGINTGHAHQTLLQGEPPLPAASAEVPKVPPWFLMHVGSSEIHFGKNPRVG